MSKVTTRGRGPDAELASEFVAAGALTARRTRPRRVPESGAIPFSTGTRGVLNYHTRQVHDQRDTILKGVVRTHEARARPRVPASTALLTEQARCNPLHLQVLSKVMPFYEAAPQRTARTRRHWVVHVKPTVRGAAWVRRLVRS